MAFEFMLFEYQCGSNKRRLWDEQNGLCFYCKCPMTRGKDDHNMDMRRLTVDHVISVKEGGTDDPFNLVGCCRRCNMFKGRGSLWV